MPRPAKPSASDFTLAIVGKCGGFSNGRVDEGYAAIVAKRGDVGGEIQEFDWKIHWFSIAVVRLVGAVISAAEIDLNTYCSVK